MKEKKSKSSRVTPTEEKKLLAHCGMKKKKKLKMCI